MEDVLKVSSYPRVIHYTLNNEKIEAVAKHPPAAIAAAEYASIGSASRINTLFVIREAGKSDILYINGKTLANDIGIIDAIKTLHPEMDVNKVRMEPTRYTSGKYRRDGNHIFYPHWTVTRWVTPGHVTPIGLLSDIPDILEYAKSVSTDHPDDIVTIDVKWWVRCSIKNGVVINESKWEDFDVIETPNDKLAAKVFNELLPADHLKCGSISIIP